MFLAGVGERLALRYSETSVSTVSQVSISKRFLHASLTNGEPSISTVPRMCAWQVFESVLHDCIMRLAFPLNLRCPFLNGFCTHL